MADHGTMMVARMTGNDDDSDDGWLQVARQHGGKEDGQTMIGNT